MQKGYQLHNKSFKLPSFRHRKFKNKLIFPKLLHLLGTDETSKSTSLFASDISKGWLIKEINGTKSHANQPTITLIQIFELLIMLKLLYMELIEAETHKHHLLRL